MQHIRRADPLAEIATGRRTEIGEIFRARRHGRRITVKAALGQADQREIAVEGNGVDHPAVVILEHVDIVVIEHPPHDNLADFREARLNGRQMQDGFRHLPRPASTRVDQCARRDAFAAAAIEDREFPDIGALGPDTARTGMNDSTPRRSINRIENQKPCFVDSAIGPCERKPKRALQRVPRFINRQIENLGARQLALPRKPVIEEKPCPQHRRRTLFGMDRQNEPRGAHQMRPGAQRGIAFGEGCARPPGAAALEIDEITVHQMRGRDRRAAAEIALFEQRSPQTAAGGVARDAYAVETASDDRNIDISHAAMISDGDHRESSPTD